MKVLVTGANGLLGQKLVKLISREPEIELFATGKGPNRNPPGPYQYLNLDVTSQESINSISDQVKANVIIHTAAMTNVDLCEKEREACWKLNVDSVEYLIDACQKHNTFLVHLSTDFIFDGKAGPYTEKDKPNPLSYYGESKLASEELLLKSDIRWGIARTVLVYGISHDMSRSNIMLWVKKNLEEGKKIRVVNDQWRTPTLAEDLAEGCWLIATKEAEGIFNISGSDLVTPYDIALKTSEFFGLDSSLIEEVDGSIFKQDAVRPAKTGFDLSKSMSTLGYSPHSLEEGIEILSEQLNN